MVLPDQRPGITPGGILIVNPRDQTAVTEDLRRHGERAKDWEWHEQHQYLHRWAMRFKERFLDPVLRTDRGRMPDPVISFEKMRHEILAAYTLVRNGLGLLDEIAINSVHYVAVPDVDRVWEYGEWGLLETLLHELIHLWQQNFGEHPVQLGRVYHNAEFVAKCEALGLHPRLGSGCHWKPADGLFAVLMREFGIAKPEAEEVPQDKPRFDWWDLGKEAKGKSTLKKWQCACGCNVRVGMENWPGALCNRCGSQYHRVDNGVPLVLFDANAAEQKMSWLGHQEGIYQPKIHSEMIGKLHELAVLTGEPMTVLVDMALREFCDARLRGGDQTGKAGDSLTLSHAGQKGGD